MVDITMCSGEGCPQKETCKRFTAPVNPYYQSYFAHPPIENGKCEMYWGEQAESQFDLLVEIMRGDKELGLYDDKDDDYDERRYKEGMNDEELGLYDDN